MKNNEQLLNLIGEIDLKYVDEAEIAVAARKTAVEDVQNMTAKPVIIQNITEEEDTMAKSKKKSKKKNGGYMKRFLPVAACAVFAFAGIFAAVKLSKDKNDVLEPGVPETTKTSATGSSSVSGEKPAVTTVTEPGDNPTTTTTTETEGVEPYPFNLMNAEVGAPFAILKEDDVLNHLNSINTVEWSPTMTVYKSAEEYDSNKEQITGLEYDEMLEMLNYYVDRFLGEPVDESRVTVDFVVPIAGNEKRLNYIVGDAYFSVELGGKVSVSLPDNFIPLNNMLNPYDIYWDANNNYYPFTDEMIKATSDEVYEKTLPFFIEAMTAPKLATHYLSLSEYNVANEMYSRREVEYRVVESGTPKRIFSKARCTLDFVTFHPIAGDGASENLTKQVANIVFYHKIDPIAIGEFALASQSKAEELLFSGDYIGDKVNPPSEENVIFAGLVYPDSAQTAPIVFPAQEPMRNYGQYDEILAPYYCFYVETSDPAAHDHGYLRYNAYYVPAISGSPIS